MNIAPNLLNNKLSSLLNRIFPVNKIATGTGQKELFHRWHNNILLLQRYDRGLVSKQYNKNFEKCNLNSKISISLTKITQINLKTKATWGITKTHENEDSCQNTFVINILNKHKLLSPKEFLNLANDYSITGSSDSKGEINFDCSSLCCEYFQFGLTNVNEVKKTIMTLKELVSVIADGIPTKLL